MSGIGALIRNRIEALYVNEDESVLVFETDGGDLIFETNADCCSETWFADILGVQALIGHVVADAEEVDMPQEQDGRSRQSSDEFYGFKITTDAGRADIIYRNSSNGYYGGSAYLNREATRPARLRQITEDFSA